MRNYTKKWYLVLAVMVTLAFAACSTEDNSGELPSPNPNIAQIVAQDPNFAFLNAAINRANLSSALAADNITLFAPDNLAFQYAGIPDINAINAIPVSTLQGILSYHIISGKRSTASFPYSDTLRTSSGLNVYASNNDLGRYVNGTFFRAPDRMGSNGYIHVLNKMLTPPAPTKSIASVVANDTTFSFLFRAVTKLNLLALLNNPNKLTVFAPTNAAFRAVGITDVDAVPVATLDAIVKSHVVPTSVFVSDFKNLQNWGTFTAGKEVITYATTPKTVRTVSSLQPFSTVTVEDIVCTNGVIQVINRVLLP